jgi:hypothetical protein
VRLPEGPLGLELVVIDAEGSSRGAYQVVLARR